MADRRRENVTMAVSRSSRRDFLKMGGAVIPVGIGLPRLLRAQSASSFDYYISPTGSDSNPGTVSSPWAITSLMNSAQNSQNVTNWNATAGKKIGLLPGVYRVGQYMKSDSFTGALQIKGGSAGSSTYVGSSDASGNYSPRTATITALNGTVYGGTAGYSFNGPIISHTGEIGSGATYPAGYATLDGLVVSGWSYKGVRIGGASSGDGPGNLQGIIVQNCEFTGAAHNAADTTDNTSALWLDGTVGAVVNNNYFHGNSGFAPGSGDHLAAIICWACSGTAIQFNTVVNSGTLWGKEVGNQGTTIQYNYIDVSMYTAQSTAFAIQDFTGANASGLTQTTYIRNNILISSCFGIEGATLSQNYGWTTPIYVYNNTIVMVQNGAQAVEAAAWMYSQITRNVRFYNNILTGAVSNDYRMLRLNANGPVTWDYNLFPASGMTWALVNDTSGSTLHGNYTSLSGVQSAISSLGGISTFDTHSVANNTPGFTGSGQLAVGYQLKSGSPAQRAGTTNGTPSGSVCDMGAWGNGATQIGCNFTTSGAPIPDAPALINVT
jgi:hypothetical protein